MRRRGFLKMLAVSALGIVGLSGKGQEVKTEPRGTEKLTLPPLGSPFPGSERELRRLQRTMQEYLMGLRRYW
jgi:hypothetical protein